MHKFLLILLLWPVLAVADISIIEFTVNVDGHSGLTQSYKVSLFGSINNDVVYRKTPSGVWAMVYIGQVSSLLLPTGTRIHFKSGPLADPSLSRSPFKFGNYSLFEDQKETGLQLQSGNKLVLITRFGAAEVPWPGEVMDAVQLERHFDPVSNASFLIFAVRGLTSSGTYIVMNGNFSHPLQIDDKFHRLPLGAKIQPNGNVYIEALKMEIPSGRGDGGGSPQIGLASPALNPFEITPPRLTYLPRDVTPTLPSIPVPQPTAKEVLDELIAQLDEREPLASMPNAETLAARAIRGMLMREFPLLAEFQQEEPDVRNKVEQLVNSLTQLWLRNRRVSGSIIHSTMIRRLEAEVENRVKCELSLLTFSGQGSHVAAFYRGKALRAMNALHRRLYRMPGK